VVFGCSLLWETLTGKEHLFFYGRLKNLKGAGLMKVFPILYPAIFFCSVIHITMFFSLSPICWLLSLSLSPGRIIILPIFDCQAVDDSLKSVNLFHGNVGDKQVRKYSGGMRRRLSVAISLIGDPKVMFLFFLFCHL
jgi:ABC-type Na+ transport system ATPase subunit NatA